MHSFVLDIKQILISGPNQRSSKPSQTKASKLETLKLIGQGKQMNKKQLSYIPEKSPND